MPPSVYHPCSWNLGYHWDVRSLGLVRRFYSRTPRLSCSVLPTRSTFSSAVRPLESTACSYFSVRCSMPPSVYHPCSWNLGYHWDVRSLGLVRRFYSRTPRLSCSVLPTRSTFSSAVRPLESTACSYFSVRCSMPPSVYHPCSWNLGYHWDVRSLGLVRRFYSRTPRLSCSVLPTRSTFSSAVRPLESTACSYFSVRCSMPPSVYHPCSWNLGYHWDVRSLGLVRRFYSRTPRLSCSVLPTRSTFSSAVRPLESTACSYFSVRCSMPPSVYHPCSWNLGYHWDVRSLGLVRRFYSRTPRLSCSVLPTRSTFSSAVRPLESTACFLLFSSLFYASFCLPSLFLESRVPLRR